MRHCDLSTILTREPGIPECDCPGELARVDGEGVAIPPDAPPVYDLCLPREGGPSDLSAIRLHHCTLPGCRKTIVEATGPDGRRWERNTWPCVAWRDEGDGEHAKPVDAPERRTAVVTPIRLAVRSGDEAAPSDVRGRKSPPAATPGRSAPRPEAASGPRRKATARSR